MFDASLYLDLIRQSHPHLTIDQASFIESGDHSRAIVINNDYIFRFPKKKEFCGEYVAEKELLDRVGSSLSGAVPALKLYEVKGQLFTCHKMIKGIEYSRVNKVTLAVKKRLARELAHFLVQLHGIKCDDRPEQPFLLNDEGIEQLDQGLGDYLKTPGKRQAAQKTIEEFYVLQAQLPPDGVVLCHNDLNENNFLVCEGHVAGIIDFGNAAKRDYSSEFAALLKYDFELAALMAHFYEQEIHRSVHLRYAFIIQKLKIYSGMKECLIQGDGEKLDRYNKWLNYLQQYEYQLKG